MGYVAPRSVIAALGDVHSTDPEIQREARAIVESHLAAYERYKQGMRSGMFGVLIGKALFKPTIRRI